MSQVHSFVAAFHIGYPLALCRRDDARSWNELRRALAVAIVDAHPRLRLLSQDEIGLDEVTRFPLGEPLLLTLNDSGGDFGLPEALLAEKAVASAADVLVRTDVWVCPSGAVLLIVRFSCNQPLQPISDELVQRFALNHYVEFSEAFSPLAQTIYVASQAGVSAAAICKQRVRLNRAAISAASARRCGTALSDSRKVLEAALLDVYFVTATARAHEDIRVGYVGSTYFGEDANVPALIMLAYSAFAGALWLIEHLQEKLADLQEDLRHTAGLSGGMANQLKQFRVLALRLISESRPVSIRITRKYVELLDTCWTEFRLPSLFRQAQEHLETLETLVDWQDAARQEALSRRLGRAAIAITFLSVTAVVAQLISTVDLNGQIQPARRIALIVLGFVLGVAVTLGLAFWRTLANPRRWLGSSAASPASPNRTPRVRP